MKVADDLLMLGQKLDAAATTDRECFGIFLADKLLRVRDRSGALCGLHANPAQRAFEERRGRTNIVLKARQMGMTSWVAGRFLLKTMLQRGVLTVQVAHTREAAEGIFGIVQRMWENLPTSLRDGPLRRSRANAGQMVFPFLDSEYRVVSAGEASAGRGLTIQNLHCSEVSRWPGDARAILAGLRAAVAPGGEVCLESTPSGAYGCFYEEWMRAEEAGVTKHFFPWWMEPGYVGEAAEGELTCEEEMLVEAHGLTRRQIGFRRELEKSFRGLRVQEFAEDALSCFKATGECCFDLEAIERRMMAAPAAVEIRRGGAVKVWLPWIRGREYLVAVDTAGGGADGDYAAVQVIDLMSGMQCAELRAHLGTLALATETARLAREYGGAMVAVEGNNHGAGVLAYLDAVERYARVYGVDGVAGWLTTAGNKPAMVSRMGALLVETPELFMSDRLLSECRTFVTGAGGRTGAAPGAHDDCLMAMAVAQAVRAERLNRR